MHLPEDCTLTYVVSDGAWYADTAIRPYRGAGVSGELSVVAAANEGGCAWEFDIVEYPDINGGVVRLRIFNEAFQAFGQVPEFFEQLVLQEPATLSHVREILDAIGARDATERTSPYASKTDAEIAAP